MSIKNLDVIDGVAQYDLVVIGSGSGNNLIGPEWDNKKVAIIDGGLFGGTCLNVGCIPTKMFVYPATVAVKAREIAELGIEAEVKNISWQRMRDRVFPERIDKISEDGRNWRASLPNVDYYREYAHFIDSHTIQTDSGQKIHGQQMVIAAGSRAIRPDVPGINLPQVLTNDTVMRMEELPQRMVVLGGGVIAAEFSHVFSALGVELTQVNRSARLLRGIDQEVTDRFVQAASKQWNLLLEHALIEIRDNGDGSVTVVLEHEGAIVDVVADKVLVATGRRSNSDSLHAEKFFDVDARGLIGVDEHQRVLYNGAPVEGVFALGDISSKYQLKHVANHEARIVQHNLSHPNSMVASDHRFVPGAVFSHPQLAFVGMTEEQARQAGSREGFEVTVKSQEFGDTAYGWAMEDSVGLCKIVARKDTGQILGAALVGEESSVLIQPIIQAMSFGLEAQQMARGQYWIHPALTEVVENALLGLERGA